MKMMKSFYPPFLLTILGTLIISSSFTQTNKVPEANQVKVIGLKCEYAVNPIGMDVPAPQLSWKIESANRGVFQTAYQIFVADSPLNLATDAGIWDSGIIKSSQSTGIKYAGPELQSRKRYFWRVRIWNSDFTISDCSETAFFEMGLLNQNDWQSDWIGFSGGRTGRVLYFKGIFKLEKTVRQARAYIS
jgi:alpha-L-rhamnosidase